MKKNTPIALIAAGTLSALCQQATAQTIDEQRSLAEDRQAVAVTIYNDSLALIREERLIPLKKGLNAIALRDVSAQIQAQTASLKSLTGAHLNLLEQNYDFDLLTPEKLLEKYVGQQVTIIHSSPKDGSEKRETATVLSAQQGIVLRYADRIETGIPENARIAYNNVPANLRDRPTLVVQLESDRAGKERLELAYLSGGFSWSADYVATLSDNEERLNLAGWVTLSNHSGSAFENAKLQLVAGEVNRVPQPQPAPPMMNMKEARVMSAAPLQQQDLFEYHMYTLNRPTTLRDNQTKQVALLSAESLPVNKEYRMDGGNAYWYNVEQLPEDGDKRSISVFIEFANKKPLGVPLPKGTVRVYKNDSEGHPLFVGEDNIEHTPKNETVKLKLGKAFDVTGNWKRTDYKIVNKRVGEQEIRIELANAKKQPVTVKVVEPILGDWKITEESYKHEKAGAFNALWNVPVPAEGKATLTYRIKYRVR